MAGTSPARRLARNVGTGLISGAADDDPSAIGTYASAGAAIGPSFLWTAPVTFPMMCAVVYLSAKLGKVSGMGLFAVVKQRCPRWVLYPLLLGVLVGNTVEAGADIGGMAAALGVLVPLPAPVIIVPLGLGVLVLQLFGSYTLIRDVLRWLALTLLAYVGAALLARPQLGPVLRGTLVPTVRLDPEFLALLVAVIGTTLSAYLYTWQSNEEVEEDIARGRRRLWQRRGATAEELGRTRRGVVSGMFFSNLVMYFIVLSTAATLHASGRTRISSAAQAADALRPLAGDAAGVLFALGVLGVGLLAVPVMTTGAAYDLCQVMGWRHSLHAHPRQAPRFYATIVVVSVLAVGLNFLGVNPMRALVLAGVVQGFSTPVLLVLILLLTNDRRVVGEQVNGRALNALGVVTTLLVSAASVALVVTWLR